MSLTPKQVQNVARLARLSLSEDDVPRYAAEMTRILELVDQLSDASTEDVTPMAHPLDLHQRLRMDVVTEEDQRDLMQQHAPQTERGCYLVPRVIE